MRYFLILVGAAVVAYLLARGIAAVLSDRKRSKKERIEMKPADLQIVKAAKPRSLAVAIGTGLLFVLILFLAFGSWFQVDQGERGVLRNGKWCAWPSPAWISRRLSSTTCRWCRCATIPSCSRTWKPTVTTSSPRRCACRSRTACRPSAWRNSIPYGTINNLQGRVLERKTPDAVKNVFGRFTAVRAIQERQKLGLDVNTAVVEAMDGAPVQVVGVQIEEVGFSKAYEHSIEQRMLAQVQIETTRQQKETAVINAEIQVVKAKAEADARRQQFTAEADGIRLRGEAEAAAIRAKAEALAANTNLVGLNAVEKWDGVLPTTQVPGAALPFIGIK